MSCGVGCRCSSDPVLMWLWCRLAATALIRPLAWEPPHASTALKRQKQKIKQKSTCWYHVTNLSLSPSPITISFSLLCISSSFSGLFLSFKRFLYFIFYLNSVPKNPHFLLKCKRQKRRLQELIQWSFLSLLYINIFIPITGEVKNNMNYITNFE